METQIKRQPEKKMNDTDFQKITPFLWLDGKAEQAANFYTGIFNDSAIGRFNYYGAEAAAASGQKEGSVMTVEFILEGQYFAALNGGPVFEISPAVSFFVNCDTEQEINKLWEKLSEGASILMDLNKNPLIEKSGRLKDQFGITWQLTIGTAMQKITPLLMFTGRQYGKAEEAMNFYISLFEHSGVIHIEHHDTNDQEFEGTIRQARFSLNEQEFIATDSNAGNEFAFTPALSFVVKCDKQEEIDHFWNELSQGGDEKAQQCGWLEDRYGLSWQIVPSALDTWLNDMDTLKAERVMKAMLPMKKLNMKTLEEAYTMD